MDVGSRQLVSLLQADLIHINRATQKTEPALASSWKVSKDNRTYTLNLRHDLRFSDGHPMTADDVVFTFAAATDSKVHSPQRDVLDIDGQTVQVTKIDDYTVRAVLPKPYGSAERLFDSVAILPRHVLDKNYRDGSLNQAWSLGVSPELVVGLGPFRFKEYVPGQRIVLARNPYYWKKDAQGHQLPYLDEIVFLISPSDDASVLRFQGGEIDLLDRLDSATFSVLQKNKGSEHICLQDAGPDLEYNFLLFNQNDLSGKNLKDISPKQRWFRDARFRRAISYGIDRDGIVRLVYAGRATPLWGHVSPGETLWVDSALPHPKQSLEQARSLLKKAGFSWHQDGLLYDDKGQRVQFTIAGSSSNAQRLRMGAILVEDLKNLGIEVTVVPLEFRSLVDRVFNSMDYEAALLALTTGDGDPTAEMNVWLSNGSSHVWRLGQSEPANEWERQVDTLMQEQATTVDYEKRKQLFNRVQELELAELPLIPIVSPHILVAARGDLGNFRPAVLEPHVLWNSEFLFIAPERAKSCQ